MSLHIIAKLTPKPGAETQLRDAMEAMVAPSRAEAGCRRYDAFQLESGLVIVIEAWDNQAALDIHGLTSHMTVFRAEIADLLAGPVAIEKLDPIEP